MTVSSTSIDDEIKERLIQLKEKIVQLMHIVSQLTISSTQALVTPLLKLSPTSKDQDLSSSKKHQGGKLFSSEAKQFSYEVGKQAFSHLQF